MLVGVAKARYRGGPAFQLRSSTPQPAADRSVARCEQCSISDEHTLIIKLVDQFTPVAGQQMRTGPLVVLLSWLLSWLTNFDQRTLRLFCHHANAFNQVSAFLCAVQTVFSNSASVSSKTFVVSLLVEFIGRVHWDHDLHLPGFHRI